MEDQEQDDQGDKAGLASSSSSDGDVELPTASGSSHQSLSKSPSLPPKPAVPRQRPIVPPRPKETNTANGNSLEPTPFDLPDHDPFQAFENNEKDSKPEEEEKKKSSPPTAPKPARLAKMQKSQQSIDTTSASSTPSGVPSEVSSIYR